MIRTAHHIHFQLLKAFPAHRILTHFLRNCFSFHTSDNSHDILFTFHINVRCRLVEDIPGSNVTVIAVAITPQNIFFNYYIFILFLRLVNVTQVPGSEPEQFLCFQRLFLSFFPIFRAFLAVSYAEQIIENFYHVQSVYFTTFQ